MKIKSNKEKKQLNRLNLEFSPDDAAGQPKDFFKKDQLEEEELNKMLDQVIEEKGDFFCSQPFIHMYMPTYGFQHVCCNTSMSVKRHISEIGIEGSYNEPEFTGIRREIVGGHQVRERTLKTCHRCIQTEARGFTSLRETYNRAARRNPKTAKELEYLTQYVIENPYDYYPLPEALHTVELKIWGNYCNLKCIMCSPEDSSSVGEEMIELGELTVDDIKNRTRYRTGSEVPFEPPLITNDDNHVDEDEFWTIIKRAEKIKLIGGETFLQKQNVQVLEKCVENGWAKDKDLIIFTNNAGYPRMEYIRDLLAQFRHVSYKCSMELWGPKNNYIRYPSNWDEVYKNMKMMSMLPNVVINPTLTLNPITLGYCHEVVEGVKEFPRWNLNFSSMGRPRWFVAQCVPDDIRDFYLERYYSLPFDVIKGCEKAIETLEQREFDEFRFWQMIGKIKDRDKLRGDNILKYFPEWTKWFENDDYYR